MGMPIIVDIRDGGAWDAELDRVFDWFRLVDERFSTYKPDSEISRLNRDELTIREVSDDVRAVLQRCEELRVETDGFFDVRAASRDAVDPSGLVKGWSVDRAGALLDAAGATHFAVNAGGDVLLRGGALPRESWRLGIQHPRERQGLAAVVEGRVLAVATSGAYERGDHVLDPLTGAAPTGVLSVTVTGPELATADAYATAAFARGENAAAWASELPARGYEALTLVADGRYTATAGFPFAT
jgi:thiamine biosynthesis lipoprotein